jgi:hypothetical protein
MINNPQRKMFCLVNESGRYYTGNFSTPLNLFHRKLSEAKLFYSELEVYDHLDMVKYWYEGTTQDFDKYFWLLEMKTLIFGN